MANDFTLSIVAPDREVLDAPVTHVSAPGESGYFGVYAGHEPFVISLTPGVVWYTEPTNLRRAVAITGGFAEVSPTRVTILADAAERAEDIREERAMLALERAEAAAKLALPGTLERTEARAASLRAKARLLALGEVKK